VRDIYLTDHHFTIEEKIEASSKFTLEDYKEQFNNWLKEVRSVWLI